MKNLLLLSAFISLTVSVGGISGYVTVGGLSDWYTGINKPSFNPPNYVFGPVWSVLYILMGISLYLIYISPTSADRTVSLQVFSFQLFLNFCWSILFFSLESPGIAFVEILILWITILTMILVFRKVSPVSAYIQVPYLLWVSFASVLNGSIWYLNS